MKKLLFPLALVSLLAVLGMSGTATADDTQLDSAQRAIACTCQEADADGDQIVTQRDLHFVLNCWGLASPWEGAPLCWIGDLNNDGIVGSADMLCLLVHFGTACDPPK